MYQHKMLIGCFLMSSQQYLNYMYICLTRRITGV